MNKSDIYTLGGILALICSGLAVIKGEPQYATLSFLVFFWLSLKTGGA